MAQSTIATASRRERRSSELLQRLLGAAMNLFADKGFAETTVEDITNRRRGQRNLF